MPFYYFIAAVVAGVTIGIWRRSWCVGILVGYMIILFSSMVLNRKPYLTVMTRFQPFETYKNWPELLPETIVNIICFIPIGLLCGKRWRGILIGLGFSLFIEIMQLITKRGYFQIDDLINNTIGTLIGVIISWLIFSYKTECRERKG